MTDLWSDPTDDMPALAARLDRRLLAVIALALLAWILPLYVTARVSYAYGASTNAPLCEGDSVSIRKVPTVWPRGPVAGARP